MSIETTITECLSHLFNVYDQNGNFGSLTEIIRRNNYSLSEIKTILVNRGLIRGPILTRIDFSAKISILGIEQLNPGYFQNHSDSIIASLEGNSQFVDLIEHLGYDLSRKHIVNDIAEYMKLHGFISIHQPSQQSVRISLSPEAKSYYEQNKAKFN